MTLSNTKTTLVRLVTGSVVALAVLLTPGSAAAADPKPEALSQIDWAMNACGMALDPTTRRDDIANHLAKFREKRDLAIAADPAITSWNGEKRGKKVSEWLPRCEKEITERVARERSEGAVKQAIESALVPCRKKDGRAAQADLDEYKRLRAAAVALNKSEAFNVHLTKGDDVNAMIAKCDKELAVAVAESAKADAASKEMAAKGDKAVLDRLAEEGKKKAAERAAERAALKGDRLKIYDKYGSPFRIEHGDSLPSAKQWKWHEHFERGVLEGWCETTVTFRGNKKVREVESGYGCRLR